ncbi:unnamed protein product [Cochlearia groenlandica]
MENDTIMERKRKRMKSNRESARRSRMRKQKQLSDMINEVNVLKSDNTKMSEQVDEATSKYIEMESKNNVLRAQALELTHRLRSFNSMLEMVQEISGQSFDIPLHIPFPLLPITSSPHSFHC